MAGKMKKGFASYLVVLLIALVAAFLICITVMLFSPFKNILGFKYFAYTKDDITPVYNETGSSGNIFDFEKIAEININCSYADVVIEKTRDVDNHAIKFVNLTSGFARANDNTDFTYELSFQDASNSILDINVHEPEGFLYFNKKVQIKVYVPYTASYILANTKINVTSTSGDVLIGNKTKVPNAEINSEIDLNAFSVKTTSGLVKIYDVIEPNFTEIFVKSNKGNVDLRKDITVSNKLEIYSTSGEVSFSNVTYSNKSSYALFDLSKSKFKANTITGSGNVMLSSGYFDVTKIDGSLISSNAAKQMKSAKLTIGEITGVVSLPFLNGSSITVNKIQSQADFYAHSTSGDIKVLETNGEVYAETTSGDITVNTSATDFDLKTTTGNVYVTYNASSIADQLDIETTKGSINMKVKSELAFNLAVYDTKNNLRNGGVNITFLQDKFTNPLKVNGGSKKLILISDGTINISLLAE